jgi:hypothetical protein
MPLPDALIAPLATLLDRIIPDPSARAAAQHELVRLDSSHDLEMLKAQLIAIVGDAGSNDPWTRRARPAFLYVMYVLLLWSLPMGLVAAVRPDMATAISQGMTAYLNALPEPLYALFGTGYLGYTAARQWGKVKGVDR